VQAFGTTHGKSLREAVTAFVKDMRGQESTLQGQLTKAMFAAISDDDELARTIVGTIMGFLPTVDGNLRSSLHEWLEERTLWYLQDALVSGSAPVSYEHACSVLRTPLMRTMQRRPVPDLVWRTPVNEHTLGGIKVGPDDLIVIGIVSATQEDLTSDPPDVFPIFGGNRNASSHPTHACPGYQMGMGVLLGTISGLLEAGTLRPTPAPLTVTLIGKGA
jgi:hypothetical protein